MNSMLKWRHIRTTSAAIQRLGQQYYPITQLINIGAMSSDAEELPFSKERPYRSMGQKLATRTIRRQSIQQGTDSLAQMKRMFRSDDVDANASQFEGNRRNKFPTKPRFSEDRDSTSMRDSKERYQSYSTRMHDGSRSDNSWKRDSYRSSDTDESNPPFNVRNSPKSWSVRDSESNGNWDSRKRCATKPKSYDWNVERRDKKQFGQLSESFGSQNYVRESVKYGSDVEEEDLRAARHIKSDWRDHRDASSRGYVDDSSHGFKSRQAYNYGLSGMGKVGPKKLAGCPPIEGEILYGVHPALLALSADRRRINKLFVLESVLKSDRPLVQQILAAAAERAVTVETCSRNTLDSLSQARPHQGVCLDVEALEFESMTSVHGSKATDDVPQLWVVLDSVQDPMNFGAVLRSSYFLGVDQVFVVQQNSCSMTPVVSKASSGVMEILKLYSIPDLVAFIKECRAGGWEVMGTAGSIPANSTAYSVPANSTAGSVPSSSESSCDSKLVPMSDVSVTKNTVLMLGNEGRGLSEDTRQHCDRLVVIEPGRGLHPLVDSLNVSVATGILLHHLCRSRYQKQEH